MKKLFVFLLLMIPSLAPAETEVTGTQSGVWAAVDSPFLVTGEIVVPAGEVLTIEPGVVVNFQGHFKLTVNGDLRAVGTSGDTILFTTDTPSIGWGGIRISSNEICRLDYCRIEYGKTAGSYPDMHGGGLALLGSDAVVSNCVFADNEAVADDLGMGGAVYANGSGSAEGPRTRFIDCQFIRNHAYGEGGAIKFTADLNTEIQGCEFVENSCGYGGGAVSCYGVYGTKLINSTFFDNYTMYSAGGAVNTLGFGNTLFVINSTFYNNTAVTGDGGAINLVYCEAYFVNTIVYDNPGMYSDDVFLDWGGNAEIHYSNLSFPDGATGSHNIDEDPLFVDAANRDLRLSDASGCIDAGIAYMVLGGETVVDLDPGEYCGLSPDLGAYEHCDVTAVPAGPVMDFQLDPPAPNPFVSGTTVSYTLASEEFVAARVYDVRGGHVRTLLQANRPVGQGSIFWNGADERGSRVSSGLYFLRVQIGVETRSMRLLLSD